MISLRLAILLLLFTGSLQAQVSKTRVSPQSRGGPFASPVPLRARWANDGTYTVSLPDGWQQLGQATLEYGLFLGTRTQAESFAVGMEQVFTNPAVLQAQLPGYSLILPRAQVVLKSRLLAPPLTPLQIVTILLPKLAGGPRGAIQNLRVNYTIPANMRYGYNGMLVGYQYIFMPGRDLAFASQAHPVLRAQRQVPMQSAAFIVTFPYMPGQASWSFGYRILSAPQAVFQGKRNQATYVGIFNSFELIPRGLALKVKSNEEAAKIADSMNQTTHDMAQNWWSELGPGGEPGGSSSASSSPSSSQPGEASCGFGAQPRTCRENEAKLCCHDQRGPDHYRCVPKSKALPAVVEYGTEYGCRPTP